MPDWTAANSDFLLFAGLVAAFYGAIAALLRRTRQLVRFPPELWIVLGAGLAAGWIATTNAGENARANLRDKIGLLLPVYAAEFRNQGHARLDPAARPDDPLYLRLILTQMRWLRLNPFIADIYTVRPATDGRAVVIVDSETDFNHDGRYEGGNEQRSPVGRPSPRTGDALRRALAGVQTFDEVPFTDPRGTWVSAYEPLHDADGRVEAVLGVDIDANLWHDAVARARMLVIFQLALFLGLAGGGGGLWAVLRSDLERRRSEARRRHEHAELQRLTFERAPGGIVLTGSDLILREANAAFGRLLGRPPPECLGRGILDFVHPDDAGAVRDLLARLQGGATPHAQGEARFVRPDGGIVTALVNYGLARDEEGAPAGLVIQFTDVSEHRRAESALVEQQQRLQTILRSAPIILFLLDRDGIILASEGAGLAPIGRRAGESVGRSIFELYRDLPESIADVQRALAGETRRCLHDVRGEFYDTHLAPVRDPAGNLNGVLGIALNVTDRVSAQREREAIERRLLDTQKLESLGLLAGGVAHDFNNLLSTILGNVTLTRLHLPAGVEPPRNLERIEQAARTAADLCQQLLAFSGRGPSVTQAVDLAALVDETAGLLTVSLGGNTALRLEPASGLPAVHADPSQLRQVVLNLVLNASEAIGAGHGTIRIGARARELDGDWLAQARTGQDLPPGEFVCLEISDDGPGMDAATLARIFDPFFTTKTTGRGLGLAAVLGIMRGNRGALAVTSGPGRGTTFTAAFPAHRTPGAPGIRAGAAPREAWRGSGTVLVVDDDDAVRQTAAHLIALFGFSALQASSGSEAIERVRDGLAVDLVVLDVNMPGMDGPATLRELHGLRPGLRVLVFTGNSRADTVRRFSGLNYAGILQKPYTMDSIGDAIRAVIGT